MISRATDIIGPPGVYEGVPARAYHASPRISRSNLWTLHTQSPAHLRAQLDSPQPPTRAMIRGSALHTAILEPERFAEGYVWPDFDVDRRSKAGKDLWEGFLAAAGGREVLGYDEHEDRFYRADVECVLAIKARFEADDQMRQLCREGRGLTEAVYCWDEDISQFRVRLDRVNLTNRGPVILDLKSTRDARPRAFQRSVFEHGYHLQAAMYGDGYKAVTGDEPRDFVFIAYETEPPYAHAFFRATEEILDAGRAEYRQAVSVLRQCQLTGHWPGYESNGIVPIHLPEWYRK